MKMVHGLEMQRWIWRLVGFLGTNERMQIHDGGEGGGGGGGEAYINEYK